MSKVLHLRSSFDPGGTETLLLNLFNYPQTDFEIHFVLLKNGSLADQLRPQNGNLVYHWYRRSFFDLAILKKLHKLVNENKITIIHTHQFIELCYAVALKQLNPRLQLIHQIHLMFSKRNLFFYLERYLSQRFAKVLTVSNSAKEELVSRFGFNERNISLLYNAICLSNGSVPDTTAVNKIKTSLPKGGVNVVMIANFVWGKDHETIFKAYDSYIRRELPNVNFCFVGLESEISDRLKQKYLTKQDLDDGRIMLAGRISNASALLPLFDIVIMSCFSETFNLSLIEAAAAGKTILASDIPVFRELSENGKYFHHFKTGDPRDLFEALEYLVRNLAVVSQPNHAQYFQDRFSFGNFVRSLNEIYSHHDKAHI